MESTTATFHVLTNVFGVYFNMADLRRYEISYGPFMDSGILFDLEDPETATPRDR